MHLISNHTTPIARTHRTHNIHPSPTTTTVTAHIKYTNFAPTYSTYIIACAPSVRFHTTYPPTQTLHPCAANISSSTYNIVRMLSIQYHTSPASISQSYAHRTCASALPPLASSPANQTVNTAPPSNSYTACTFSSPVPPSCRPSTLVIDHLTQTKPSDHVPIASNPSLPFGLHLEGRSVVEHYHV